MLKGYLRFRAGIPLLIFLVLMFFLGLGLKHDPNTLPSVLIGKRLPAFSASSLLDGHEQVSEQRIKGKVTLINVWASWCYACRAEHAVLLEIKRSQAVTILGVNYKDTRTAAQQMLKTLGNPYEAVVFDPHGALAMNLGVLATPETFLIDRKGVIRYRHVGAISPDVWKHDLLPRIQRLQGEQHEHT